MSTFYDRCIEEIDSKIKRKSGSALIEMSWISPTMGAVSANPFGAYMLNWTSNPMKESIEHVYARLKIYYWNEKNIGINFEGCNSGSHVPIYYLNDQNKIKKYAKINQNKHDQILKMAQDQLNAMDSGHKQVMNMPTVNLIGMHWPYVIKSVSNSLKNGTIIKDFYDGTERFATYFLQKTE